MGKDASTNLSQQKRDELIQLCEELKKKNPDDALDINKIISYIKSKKYGLVFEEHEEQVDKDLKDNIPVFIDVSDKAIITDKNLHYNFLLEGDNLHSLKLLEKTHKDKIDVIYIDPPYNTGKKDFTYNDKNVGIDDGYRHSKWLSFMKERLEIARRCLSKTGLIFISIDEYEYAQLKLLCDEVFNEINYVENFIWIKNSTKNNSLTTSTNHEYILCYAKDKTFVQQDKNIFRVKKEGFDEVIALVNNCLNSGKTPEDAQKELRIFLNKNKQWKGIQQYKHIDEDYNVYRISDISAPNGNGPHYDVIHPITGQVCKTPSRGWCFTQLSMQELIKNNRVLFGKDEKNVPQYKRFLTDVDTEVMKSTILDNTEGKKELATLFNVAKPAFTNPKPTTLLKTILKAVSRDAIVLDFFAGSGTTGQAVLELNKEDEGNRRFILCTNNEANICEEITYQRLRTVITGKRIDGSKYSDGIPGNLKYFKTNMVDKYNEELKEILCQYIETLIELQHFSSINSSKIKVIWGTEDLNKLKEVDLSELEIIYMDKEEVFPNAKELKFLEDLQNQGIQIKDIPRYYYKEVI